jgi:hypothetical protein
VREALSPFVTYMKAIAALYVSIAILVAVAALIVVTIIAAPILVASLITGVAVGVLAAIGIKSRRIRRYGNGALRSFTGAIEAVHHNC